MRRDRGITWSSDEDLKITQCTKRGGRRRPLVQGRGRRRDGAAPRVPSRTISGLHAGMISGTSITSSREHNKVFDGQYRSGVTINIYRKEGSTLPGSSARRRRMPNGYYSYTLAPADEWGVYKVEETLPHWAGRVSQPAARMAPGRRDHVVPNKQVDFENRLITVTTTRTTEAHRDADAVPERPTPTTDADPDEPCISGTRYQVDENDAVIGAVGGINITIELVAPSAS